MNIVEAGQNKTASGEVKGDAKGNESLLDKLARELGVGEEKTAQAGASAAPEGGAGASVTAPAAPAAEGAVEPAASSVAGAAAPVVAATEAVATPQTTIAGGNPAEAAAGETPAPTKPSEGVAISAGDGKVTDANLLHKTPAAVAAAASDTGGAAKTAEEKTAEEKTMVEADKIGAKIAESFQNHLEKVAEDQEYTEALGILKEGGLLDTYNIKDEGLTKEASEDTTDYLAKIADNQPLSRQDIIGAAYQTLEMEKQAEEAEEAGREDARNLVKFLDAYDQEKTAQDAQSTETKEASAEAKPTEAKPAEAKPTEGEEKLAALLKDENVVAAVKVLKEKNLL